ncbi:hypothetical protein DAEQUDRAFT_452942 [Daedalea quercina L-15889]|uniref:Uncharacterized protein n=1 Tax=Daedalea quercina L-15889 TaxID=1314783 RepID=A0A165N502_9APHY|nr:hypothetical protein DAEQUDRAFT_452942 [Daedalea quercina L-15889]
METSLQVLKKAISRSKLKDKRIHAAAVQQVSSLIAVEPAEDTKRKLLKILRQSLMPIYSAYPLPALQWASTLFHTVYHEKVLAALGKQLPEEKREWEDVLTSLLSGVLDYLDDSESDKVKCVAAKDAIGAALYPALCDICFSLTAPMQSVSLRCTAYTLLSDAAASHIANQKKLRDQAILGGERLGSLVWRTKDYLALESLLTLFARILPSPKDSNSGSMKRSVYIKSVFLSPQHTEHTSVGQAIVQLLEYVSSNEWEETCRQIIDALAAAYVAYPQPFVIDKVKACDETKLCDRLYVDDKAFLFNALIGDDQCEALEVPYTTIRKLEVVPGPADGSVVNVSVNTPPVVGQVPVRGTPTAPLIVTFTLSGADVHQFYSAARSRNLGRLLKDAPHKLSLAETPACLDFDAHGHPVKELSQSERIENVEKFYQTNQSSDDLLVASPQRDVSGGKSTSSKVASSAPAVPPAVELAQKQIRLRTATKTAAPLTGKTTCVDASEKPGTRKTRATTSKVRAPAQKSRTDAMAAPSSAQKEAVMAGKPVKVLSRTRSQKIREKVFGASDEELSEVSDVDDAPLVSKTSRPAQATNDDSSTERRAPLIPKQIPPAVRPGAARRVLDSDDEETGYRDSADTAATGRRPTGNKRRVVPPSPEPGDDNGVSEPLDNHFVTPPRSQVNSAPAPSTPAKPPAGRLPPPQQPSSPDVGILDAMPSGNGKPLSKGDKQTHRALDIAANRATDSVTSGNAASLSDTCVAPKDLLKPRGVVQDVDAETAAPDRVIIERTRNGANSRRTPEPKDKRKESGQITFDRMESELVDHIMNSSSPIPVIKPERTSVKAKLRKRDQALVEDKKAAHVKTSKRKRVAVAELEAENENAEPPVKKPRAERLSTKPSPLPRTRRTDSRILRPSTTAAARATQRYRAKKDKTSSPVSQVVVVDYDELPGNGTNLDSRARSSPTTARASQRTKDETDKGKAANRPTRRMHPAAGDTKAKDSNKEDRPLLSDPAPFSDHDGFVSAGDVPLGVEDLRDEEEVTRLLAKPSKPSVTVVKTPVVEAMKASAASSALRMNPFVEPTMGADSSAKGTKVVVPQRKNGGVSGTRSSKLPWLVTPQADDRGPEKPSRPGERAQDRPITARSSPKPQSTVGRHTKTSEVSKTQRNCGDKSQLSTNDEISSVTKKQNIALEPQIETIDLTVDDTPVKRREAPLPVFKRQPSPIPAADLDDTLVDPPQLSTSTPFRKPGAFAGEGSLAKSARSVTFAPNIKEKPFPPSPLACDSFAKVDGTTSQTRSVEDSNGQKRAKPTKLPSQIHLNAKQSKFVNSPSAKSITARKTAGVDNIVEVLEELQQAILHRITQRFEGVREDVRFGRDLLLSEAFDDLSQMHSQRVSQFNRLIDLEADYAKMGRLLTNGYDQLLREGQNICSGIGRMVSDHDRGSLIQRMPVDLAALPECLHTNDD